MGAKSSRSSPTQRSLALLRRRGYTVAIGEKWNPHARVRQDLFGFGDLLACGDGRIFLVQCTSGDNHSKRRRKIQSAKEARRWLQSGGKILILSWAKQGPRGKRKLWIPREEWVVIEGLWLA